jgi:hypothetical protein
MTRRNQIMMERLRFTPRQVEHLRKVDMHRRRRYARLSATPAPSMLMTAEDADTILDLVPREGRTAMAIRRKVAAALRAAEAAAEVRS